MVYSSHRCLGAWDAPPTQRAVDVGSIDATPLGAAPRLERGQPERTCLFRHVCYEAPTRHINGHNASGRGSTTGGWTYYASPDEFAGATHIDAAIDLWARGGFGRHHPPKDHRFTLRRCVVPTADAFAAPLLVKVVPFAPSNFGHLLGNALYPVFVAAWRFYGAQQPPLQVLFDGPNQTDFATMRRRCGRRELPGTAGPSSPKSRRGRRLAYTRPRGGATGAAARTVGVDGKAMVNWRCQRHIALVQKFVRGLLPGLSAEPALWEGSLPTLARQETPTKG